MKYIAILIFAFILNLPSEAQEHKTIAQPNGINISYDNYILLKYFLFARKQNPQFNSFAVDNNTYSPSNAAYFFIEPKNYWSVEQSNAFYGRLKMDMQKEFAPPILYDNRFVAHSIPVSNGSQNYQWIPSNRSKQSFGEQMAGTVVRSLLGIKQDNSNGHYSSSGIKY